MQNQGELRDCPQCDGFFIYTGISDSCAKCVAKEEKVFDVVNRFLRRRENRTATIEQIVEATDVTEKLLHKWVRRGRLQPSMFPNLGYPCDNCGELTTVGKLCGSCTDTLKSDLRQLEAIESIKGASDKNEKRTYLSARERN